MRYSWLVTMVTALLMLGLAVWIDLIEVGWQGLSLPALFLYGAILTPILLLSLVGIHLDQAAQLGTVGWISFVVLFVGTSLAGSVLAQSFALAVYAQQIPELNTYFGIHVPIIGAVGVYNAVSSLLFLVGWLLYGILTWRHGIYAQWAVLLMTFGLPLAIPLRLPVAGGRTLGFAIWACGYAWIGWQQRSHAR